MNQKSPSTLTETRAQMLSVFPGLESYWDRDGGLTFLETFFLIYCAKMKVMNHWVHVRFHDKPIPELISIDIDLLMQRMTPLADDFRPLFSDKHEEYLDALNEDTLYHPVHLSYEKYLKTLEMCINHTVTDEKNSELMGSWLASIFELKMKEVQDEI